MLTILIGNSFVWHLTILIGNLIKLNLSLDKLIRRVKNPYLSFKSLSLFTKHIACTRGQYAVCIFRQNMPNQE